MLARLLTATRGLIVVGVFANLVIAAALLLATLVRAVALLVEVAPQFAAAATTKKLAVTGIEIADYCLIATVLYIVGLGLYELFIGPVRLPDWLVIASLDDLKDKLISGIVVVLAVTFAALASSGGAPADLLPFGLAVGVVILALAAYTRFSGKRESSAD